MGQVASSQYRPAEQRRGTQPSPVTNQDPGRRWRKEKRGLAGQSAGEKGVSRATKVSEWEEHPQAREEHGKGLGQIPRAAKKEREEAIIPKEDHAFLLEE